MTTGLTTGQVLTPKPSTPELEARAVCLDPMGPRFEVLWTWREERPIVTGTTDLLATLRPDLVGMGKPIHWWKVFGSPAQRSQWLGSPLLPPERVAYVPRPASASRRLTKAQRLARAQVELYQGTGALGIDLVNRADEVLKLFMAGFGRRLLGSGYSEAEVYDVLQEVYKGLLVRNAGTCPWDPAKGTFGTYVHRVCGCIVSNYIRKRSRIKGMEQVGVYESRPDEGPGLVDVGDARTIAAGETQESQVAELDHAMVALANHVRGLGEGDEVVLAVKMIPLVYQGMNHTEIAQTLGVRKTDVSKANKVLKAGAEGWRESM